MATRFAIASGNWSDPAIWDSGALPVAGDVVYANGYTIAIDQNITVDSIRNDASPVYVPAIATPAMINNVSPSGIVTGTGSIFSGSLFNAFDQSSSAITFNTINAWNIQYQFPSAKTIIRYAFYTGPASLGRQPATWSFQASNDGSTWTTLHSVTGASLGGDSWYNYTFTNTTPYLYYRMNVTALFTITQQGEIREIQMTESSSAAFGGVVGGGFTLASGYTINANLTSSNGILLSYTASSPASATINGYVNIRQFSTTLISYGVYHTGTGTLTINGDVYTTASPVVGSLVSYGVYCAINNGVLNINGNVIGNTYGQSYTYALYIASNFTVNVIGDILNYGQQGNYAGAISVWIISASTFNIIGDVYGSNGTGGSTLANTTITINCTSAANINITGNVYGPTGNSALSVGNFTAMTVSAAANVTITGNVIGGGSTGQGIYSSSTPTISITGNIVGSGYQVVYLNGTGGTLSCTGVITAGAANAVFVTSQNILCTLSGPFINTSTGVMAVNAPKVLLTTAPTKWYLTNSSAGDRTLYSSDFPPDYPNTQDVRSGVSYNGGLLTGVMVVPAASSVASGVPVGSTTGTAFITSAQVGQAVWDYLISNINIPSSIGDRLKDASTVTTTGSQIQALNGL